MCGVLRGEKVALAKGLAWPCFTELENVLLVDRLRFQTLKSFVEQKYEAIKQQMEGPNRNEYLKGRLEVCEEILREAESIGER